MTLRGRILSGIGRLAFRAAGWDAAVDSRQRRTLGTGRQAKRDEDRLTSETDFAKVRAICMNLYRNSAVVPGIVARFTDNVVGPGVWPQAKTTDSRFNDEAEAYYREQAKVADYRGRVTWETMQRWTVALPFVMGDWGLILRDNGQVHPIEAERIATPDAAAKDTDTFRGVKVSRQSGVTLGYYVCARDDNGDVNTKSGWEYVPRENFIYIGRGPSKRPDQVRSLPEIAPIVNVIVDQQELQTSNLGKAKLDAMQAWLRTTSTGADGLNMGARWVDKGVDAVPFEKFEDMTVHNLKPGEDMRSLASTTPNAQYEWFDRLLTRKIGTAIGTPYEFVALDFSQTNFSNARAALLQAYRTFEGWQTGHCEPIFRRHWNWKIAKAIKAGDIRPAPIVEGKSTWWMMDLSWPEWDWVDPQAQAQAELLEWQLCVNTITNMNRKRGRDVGDVMREKVYEIGLAQELADAENAKRGTTLTWRDVISAVIPGQTAKAPTKAAEEAEPEQESESPPAEQEEDDE